MMSGKVDAQKIRQLLQKSRHFDKDERFMATSDLQRELENVDGQLNSGLQGPIRDAILKQLDDTSNDVQAIACRCLATCVKKFNKEQVDEIIDKVGERLITGRAELRDIYSIALKTIINSVPEDYGSLISATLCKQLMTGLSITSVKRDQTANERKDAMRNDYERKIICLDILKDLLTRFGAQIPAKHPTILERVKPILDDEKNELRKKAAITLGSLVPVLNEEMFDQLIRDVLMTIDRIPNSDNRLFSYIQSIGVFSRNAGSRIGKHLDGIMKKLIEFCEPDELEMPEDAKNELLENSLQAFEAIVTQCPEKLRTPGAGATAAAGTSKDPFFGKIIVEMSCRLMMHDPNFSYADGAAMETDEPDDDDWGDDDDDAGGDDDWGADGGWDQDGAEADSDDTSWKVRRAAIKCLSAFIRAKSEDIVAHAQSLTDILLMQFREHDENVKKEVFMAFRELLMATAISEDGQNANAEEMDEMDPLKPPPMIKQRSSLQIVGDNMKNIMPKCIAQLKSGSTDTKVGILRVLRELVVVHQAKRSRSGVLDSKGLSPYFPELMPEINKCIQDSDIVLRQKGLRVLFLIITLHEPELIRGEIPALTEVVCHCAVNDNYNIRVKSQALMVIGQLLKTIRDVEVTRSYEKGFDPIVKGLYSAAFAQLRINDIEMEVKQAAISAVAIALSNFGDVLTTELQATLPILQKRLENEVTQMPALAAFKEIARSPLHVNLTSVAEPIIRQLKDMLKKNSQTLRHSTAVTLNAMLVNSGPRLSPAVFPEIIRESASLVSDQDLQLCHLVLELLITIVQVSKKSTGEIGKFILPNTYSLVVSPLIQGSALDSLKRLLGAYQASGYGNYEELKQNLLNTVRADLSKQSFTAISKCVAEISFNVDAAMLNKAVKNLRKSVESKAPQQSQISLLSIGEIGRMKDLSDHKGLEDTIFKAFLRQNESVKWAASHALGSMAGGNLGKYLPLVLTLIERHPKNAYLLLNSLKEIIVAHSSNPEKADAILPYSAKVLPLLLNCAEYPEEGVRTMVAECLGKFVTINQAILGEIEALLNTENQIKRGTMVAAIKYSLSKNMNFQIPDSTKEQFFNALNDKSLETTLKDIPKEFKDDDDTSSFDAKLTRAMDLVPVRKLALQTLNAFLHTQPKSIMRYLQDRVLPQVYASLPIEEKLQRVVDLGPFKHTVDSQLPIRKSAYQCMDTLLEAYDIKTIGLDGYIAALKCGITDTSDDIQIVTLQIFTRLSQWYGKEILAHLDGLVGIMTKGIMGKLQILKRAKSDEDKRNTKTADRARDVLRIFTKCLWTMNNLPEVTKEAKKFAAFWPRVAKTKDLIPMIAELQKE